MKVAAYQAPLLPEGSLEAIALIRAQVEWCESEGVSILCCPEAILGGLADYAPDPARFAIAADRLNSVLAPLASQCVTTILGFTELADGGRLYNSAAILDRGTVVGVYRKMHPAVHGSVYDAGREPGVFQIGALTIGVFICNDSNFPHPAQPLSAHGAQVLFVPTNNGLPAGRASVDVVAAARSADVAAAGANSVWVVRADVAGTRDGLMSYGCSEIVNPLGTVTHSARPLREDLLIADIDTPH